MLINSNSKLCNYNTSAEIQIIWCPWGEGVRIFSCSTQQRKLFPSHQGNNAAGRLPAPRPLQRVLILSFLRTALRRIGLDSWQSLALMPLATALGGAGPHQVISGQAPRHTAPAFSQWPKWQPRYLQNMNCRCHGNGTTLLVLSKPISLCD